MFKNCRILNKSTNEIYFGHLDTNFISLTEYELIDIPDDGKIYKYENGQVVEDVEKQSNINNLKIKKLMQEIEIKQQRALREAILYSDKTYLLSCEEQLKELRSKLI